MEMNDWTLYETTPPPATTRVEVSDGVVIIIAYWTADGENRVWFLDNKDSKDFEIKWWRPLPKLPPKIEENPEETGASTV